MYLIKNAIASKILLTLANIGADFLLDWANKLHNLR